MAKTKFELYKDTKGNYRWRLIAQNGEAVASSGEGFTEKRTALNAIKKLKDWSSTLIVIDFEKIKEDAEKEKAKAKKAVSKAATKKSVIKKEVAKTKKTVKKVQVKKVAPKKEVAEAEETKTNSVI
jgi:uncharacterized protein